MPKPAPIIAQTFSSILIYPTNIKTDVIVDKANVKKMLKNMRLRFILKQDAHSDRCHGCSSACCDSYYQSRGSTRGRYRFR